LIGHHPELRLRGFFLFGEHDAQTAFPLDYSNNSDISTGC
jgi:hypothetical protein